MDNNTLERSVDIGYSSYSKGGTGVFVGTAAEIELSPSSSAQGNVDFYPVLPSYIQGDINGDSGVLANPVRNGVFSVNLSYGDGDLYVYKTLSTSYDTISTDSNRNITYSGSFVKLRFDADTSSTRGTFNFSLSGTTQKGWLQATISPTDAVTAGAQWCVNGTCYNSGAKAELAAGTYTVEYKTLTDWIKPANQTVTITSGQTGTLTGIYAPVTTQKGYLQVTISPADAISAGAQWCVNGTCYNSGAKAELAAGTYTVEYKTLTDWIKPANQTVTITSGQTGTLTGIYAPVTTQKGYLQVTISPADAISAGAQWCVNGTCYNSGAKAELAAGTYTVEFKTVTGWTKPANQTVTISSGQTAAANGIYTKISGSSFVSRTLSCYIAGNKLTVSLNASPATSVSSYVVEDTPPAGWTVSNINNSGSYDSVNNKVKYGPFFGPFYTALALTYDVTPPSGQTGDKIFAGTASADGVNSTIGGDSVISVCANTHPADTDKNFAISGSEITAYGSAWKKGAAWAIPPNPIPSDYLSKAGAIWKGGEKYRYDAGSGNCPLCWVNTASVKTKRMIQTAGSSAVCDMPAYYTPGQAFTVSIAVTPSSDATAYIVEDSVLQAGQFRQLTMQVLMSR